MSETAAGKRGRKLPHCGNFRPPEADAAPAAGEDWPRTASQSSARLRARAAPRALTASTRLGWAGLRRSARSIDACAVGDRRSVRCGRGQGTHRVLTGYSGSAVPFGGAHLASSACRSALTPACAARTCERRGMRAPPSRPLSTHSRVRWVRKGTVSTVSTACLEDCADRRVVGRTRRIRHACHPTQYSQYSQYPQHLQYPQYSQCPRICATGRLGIGPLQRACVAREGVVLERAPERLEPQRVR